METSRSVPETAGRFKGEKPGDDLETQALLGKPTTYEARSGGVEERWPGELSTEKMLRRGFLRKVYGILAVQMLITIGIIALFLENPRVTKYVNTNPWVLNVSLVLYLITSLTLICCGDLRRRHPHGLICLGLFTVTAGILVGAVCATYSTLSVLYAGLMTAGAFLGLTVYAFQTKYDFTVCGGMMCALMSVLMMMMFCLWLFPSENSPLNFVYAGFGALLMCAFIIHDTQLMMGGQHKVKISLDESVFAALNLYLDILNLFLFLLRLLGDRR